MDPLLGRESETARLTAAVRDVTRGTGAVVWLEGEPGIGKTALLKVVTDYALAQGVDVFRTAAQEALQLFPLRVFFDLFAGKVPESVQGADVADPIVAAIEEIVDAVATRCAVGPLLLAIDDLQWADADSLVAWGRLVSDTARRPLLLIGTFSAPPGVDRQTWRPRTAAVAAGGTVLRLAPLEPDQAMDLLRRSLPGRPGPRLTELLRQAGGNPLFVTELANALVKDDLLTETAGVVEPRADRAAPPASLAAALDRRLGLLTAATRGLLRLAALLGAEFDAQELAVVLDRRPADLVDALQEAHAADVITETEDGRLAFRHGLLRRALADQLSASLRSALQHQYASALAAQGAPFTTVASHLLAAGGPLPSWVAGWLAELPVWVLRASADPAAVLLASAQDGQSVSPAQREILAARLLPILRWLGRESQADAVAAQLLQVSTDPQTRTDAWLARTIVANRAGRFADSLALSERALDDELLTGGHAALIRARRAIELMVSGAAEESRSEADRALEQAEAAGDAIAIATARQTLSYLARDPARALAHVDAGLAAVASAGQAADTARLYVLLLDNRLAALNNLGRPEAFRQTARQVPDVVQRVGRSRASNLLLAAAMGSYDFGDWEDALSYLAMMPDELPTALSVARHGQAALILAHQQRWERTAVELAAGSQFPVTSGDARIFSGYLVAANAMRAEADGDLPEAAQLLATWIHPADGIDSWERYMWLPELTRIALTIGDEDLAAATVAAAEADAALPDAPAMQRVAARFCRAQHQGDAEELLRVATAYDEHGWQLMRAFAGEEAAVRLAAGGDGDAARRAFNDAVRTYSALGAEWDLRRADARLRPLGVRRGSRTLDQRPVHGWEALTPAERRVAELVAQGRSNPEVAKQLYLSPRTVQTHVTRILRKLDYASRMELVRAAAGSR